MESQTKPANRRSGQAVTKRGNDPDEDDATVFIVSPPPAPGKGRTPLVGSPGHDQIDGSDDRDEIHGGNGDDVIGGRLADDWIDGESGDDVIDGDEGNDTLLGGDGDNFLHGGSGDDWLHANHGIDSLHGGPGADTLAGGGDGDTFVWLAGDASGGVDRIEDFNPDEGDTLHVADLLNSMGYQGDGSASSLEGFLRLNGTILEISQNNGEFTALVDLRIPQSINDLVAKGVLRATGRPPDRKE